jgi:serine/threonine-protein kinase
MRDLVGATVGGKYHLKRRIGAGGMGVVYEATHAELQKRVAIKIMDATRAESEAVAARFRREARAASAVASDHIVQVFDVGLDDDVGLYMVMELLSGEDLATRLVKAGGRLPLADAVTIGVQAARGLAKAHAAGVVHRDLKPANLFLTTREDGSLCLKLLDFGISKLLFPETQSEEAQALTHAGAIIGTPMYMSPEQARGEAVDASADIWSLGAVLYEVLSGKKPYEESPTIEMLLHDIATRLPEPLSKVAPWVPREVATVVESAFVHEASSRPHDAGEIARQLAEAGRASSSSSGTRDARGVYAAGEIVHGYRIVGRIRSGGMATLYLAAKQGAAGFTRPVAIKAIHPHLAQDPEFERMFVEEARLLAHIADPNVVHVEELVEQDGALLLVMEYVQGCALVELLRALAETRRRFLPDVAAYIAIEIAAGLHAAHEATNAAGAPLGIVHRDVSPQNVLLARQGHVKLIDFGVAKAGAGRVSTTGSLRGKVGYMSPEQAWGRAVDRRTDVYALGNVLWEMLTTRRLFDGSNELALLESVRSPRVAPPHALVSGVPRALSDVVMAALEPAPERRPATANELRRMLADAAPGALAIEAATLAKLVSLVVEDDPRLSRIAQEGIVTGAAPIAAPSIRQLTGSEAVLQTLSLVDAGPPPAPEPLAPPPAPVAAPAAIVPPPPVALAAPPARTAARSHAGLAVLLLGVVAALAAFAGVKSFRRATPSHTAAAAEVDPTSTAAVVDPTATAATATASPTEAPPFAPSSAAPAVVEAPTAVPSASGARRTPPRRTSGAPPAHAHAEPPKSAQPPSVQIVDGVPIVVAPK